MSLVPYSSRDSREIVLRHNDAIVVRDPRSKQLVLRGTGANSVEPGDCPYCHQPLRTQSPERDARSPSSHQESFVSPEYFRMLHLASDGDNEDHQHSPSSPIRRLVQPAFASPRHSPINTSSSAEFVASSPAETRDAEGQGIKREALSPNYFRKFFIEEKELGRGGKGVVLLVRHELDGVFLGHFACKRVPVGDDHAWLEKVLIEVQLLQRLSHPNLVSYRHVWLEDVKLNRFSPSVPCAFILQQYCNSGDLLHYIIGDSPAALSTKEQLKAQMRRRSKGHAERPHDLSIQRKLAFEEIYSFFKDIASGLAHLHASNYIHRDLKPSNCLLHRSGNEFKCLISDFGEVQAESIVRKSTGATGTISYCAPEVLKKDATGQYANFTTKSDIFSLGMILYFMCFGRLPYSSADNIQEEFEDLDMLRAEISTWSGFKDERQERPDLPDQLYEFLKRLLAISPLERPSAEEILDAIRTEKGLDSPPRVGRTNSSNGHLNLTIGKRIEPLDTPGPGTPDSRSASGNRSHFFRSEKAHTPEEETCSENHSDSDSYLHPSSSKAPSNIRIPPRDLKDHPHFKLALSPDRENESFIARHSSQSPPPQTPLLMPPPSTPYSNFNHRLNIFRHQNSRAIMFGFKLLLFIIKMGSLSKACLPKATEPVVSWPLMLLAALDLGGFAAVSGGSQGRYRVVDGQWWVSGLSTIVHFVILSVVGRWGGLCVGGGVTGFSGKGREWEFDVA